MKKNEELHNPNSCLNKAREDELVFVLLESDPASARAIRAWVEERILLGKNRPGDEQVEEALACASFMDKNNTPFWHLLREEAERHDSDLMNGAPFDLGGIIIACHSGSCRRCANLTRLSVL